MKEKDSTPLDVSQETKAALPLSLETMKHLQTFLTEHPYPFYTVLLGTDDESDKFLKDYVGNNWDNLHYMSGDNTLFLSLYPPNQVNEKIVNSWKDKLGDTFEQIWEESPETSESYVHARNLGIPFSKLPCLFIGTSLEKEQGIVIKIPKWEEADLSSLFKYIFDKLNDAAGLNEQERLEEIEKEIDRFYTSRITGLYIKNHWMEYVNPKQFLKEILGIIMTAFIGALKNWTT